jgi:hypothetical protein
MKSQLLKSISESNNNTYAEGGEIKVKNIIMAKKDPIQYKGFTINYLRGEYRADAYASPQFTNTNLAKLKKEINEYLRDEPKGGSTYAEGGEMAGYKIRGYETEDYDNESDVDYVLGSKSDAINSARQHWESGDYDLIVVQMIEDEDEEQIIDPDPVFEITRSEGEYEFSKGGSTYAEGGEIDYTVWVGNMPLDINGREELTLEEAELLKREWEKKGYDDVVIDKITINKE